MPGCRWVPAVPFAVLALLSALRAQLPAAGAVGKDALVDRCEHAGPWRLNAGAEFPGATGTVALAEDAEKGPCLRLDYDFTGGGNYVTAERPLDLASATAISFLVRQDGANRGFLRLCDATGQEHAGGFAIQGDGWQKVVLPLDAAHFAGHWHGANDGQFHFPVTRVVIGVNNGPSKKGYVFIKDLAFRTTDAALYVGLGFSTPEPGNVAFTGRQNVPLTVLVENRLDEVDAVSLALAVEDWHGRRRVLPNERLALAPRGRVERRLDLDARQPQYYRVSAQVTRDGTPVASGWAGVVVTEKPHNLGVDDPVSFFGIQSTSAGARTERLGVKWVRAGCDWRWGEMVRGNYRPGSPAGARANHQLVMYCLTAYPPSWAQKLAGDEPFWEGAGSAERVAWWADYVEQTARLYSGLVHTFEVQNEPDLTCMYQVGLSFDAGVERYLRILRAAAPAIRRGAGAARIAGIDVSGGDYDRGLPYSEAVMARAGDLIDVYTGHPYAGVRYFGEGLKPLWPGRNAEARKCRDTLAMIARHGGRQPFWVGEKGWGLDVRADPLSEVSRDFARCLVQSMVTAHAVPGVERYFWFIEEGCNEGGYEYGLFRGGQPLPAALAYATLANLLHHARPVASPEVSRLLQTHCFVSPELRQGTLVLWSEGERATVEVRRLPAAWTALDLMGRELAHGRRRSTLRLTLDRSPVYVRFPEAAAPAFCERLSTAIVEYAEPVTLQTAYVADLGHLAARLQNITPKPVACEVRTGAADQELTLAGNTTTTVLLTCPGLRVGEPREFAVCLRAAGTEIRLPVRVDLAACPRVSADVSDRQFPPPWASGPPFRLDRRADILPPDPTVGWSGPADLSATAWFGWNERGLLVAVAARDDVHHVGNAEATGFWNSDSLQIAVDPLNDASPEGAYDPDDAEVGLVLAPDGPRAYQSVPAARRLDVPCTARRDGDTTAYLMTIPWGLLGITPRPGLVLGLSFILNDNDGNGRGYWLGLTPGIGEAKRPWVFRDVVLVESTGIPGR